jgi:aryl-alcohol dehydrogenase-like predicted oxidoreductase
MTGFRVSRIGFGCAPMGGYDYGNVREGESIDAVHKALDMGINFFDTADVYGFGRAEEVLGRALGTERNNVIIATKFGLKWDASSRVSRDCSKKRVYQAIEGSLRRLKIEAITLYQIHWPDPETSIEETMEALLLSKEAGKIKHIGCSNFKIDLVQQCQKVGRLEFLQDSYNLVDRAAEKELLSYCTSE